MDKHFNQIIFEQYKLTVEMADRVSARRALANSLFVGIHSAIITAIIALISKNQLKTNLLGFIPILAGITLCFLWSETINSYKQLNAAKFKVIKNIEDQLPLKPYTEEWEILNEKKKNSKYRLLSHVEMGVPICIGALYILLYFSMSYIS